MRTTGTYAVSTTLGEPVQAFVPHALPPAKPVLPPECYVEANRAAELALARLSAVAGLAPSVDWLLYSAIRKEALLKTVVDVRELPLSRKKGFSKSAFCAALSAHGIAYLHATALGCPKPIRNQYKMDGNWQTYTRKFLA